MAKGLTTAPLVLAVYRDWLEKPAILDLAAKGHTVLVFSAAAFMHGAVDVIIAPSAGWDEVNLQPRTRKNGTTYYPFCDQAVLLARQRRTTNGS